MIEMLQPKFIDVEIVINDSILLTQTKILFGYEVESDRQIVEIELNADYNCTSLIKFGQEKEVSLNELAKTNLNKRLEVEINGKIIRGMIEFTKEMKAEKFLDNEKFKYEINFDFIPKFYIKTKSVFIHKTNIFFSARVLSNHQITHIFSENSKITGVSPFCEQKGVDLIFSEIKDFSFKNVYKIFYCNSKLFKQNQQLTIGINNFIGNDSNLNKNKEVFKKPYPKFYRKSKAHVNLDKENVLIKNLKLLYNLKIKEDDNPAKNMRKNFKNKIVKFGNLSNSLLTQFDDELLKILSK